MKAALFQKRAEHQPIHSNPSLPQVVAENDPALVNTSEHVLGRIKLYTGIVLEKALASDEWTFGPVGPELLDQWLRPTPEWQAEQANYSPATKQRILKALMTELQALQNAATGADQDPVVAGKIASVVDTPAFKSWFGASKIVDAQGNPLRMYHGAIWNGPQTSGTFYPKTYLTPDPAYASRYARSYGSVYPLYAKCTKPLDLRYLGVGELSGEALREVLTSKGIDPYAVQDHGSAELDPERCRYASYPLWGWFTRTSTLGELIQRAGFDGVWMMEIGDAGGEPVEALIVWSPDQIKSAIGNNGDFDPGNAQITASDRKVKDTLKFQGFDIAVEYPAGATRKGVAPDGTKWERPVTFPYGYIKRTDGADGDSIDCYVGPNDDAPLVYVVNQFQKDGTFDEHKVMLGFDDAQAALKGYLVHMPDDWTQYGPLTSMTLPEFRHWLLGSGATKVAKPIEVPQGLVRTVIRFWVTPFISRVAQSMTEKEWDEMIAAKAAAWVWDIHDPINHFLPSLRLSEKDMGGHLRVGFFPNKSWPDYRVVEAQVLGNGGIQILLAQMDRSTVAQGFPEEILEDLEQSLTHEISHLIQGNYQGWAAHDAQIRKLRPMDNSEFINHNYEVKALSAELCASYRSYLERDPDLTVHDFLQKQWQWPKIQKRMGTDGQHTIIKDLAFTQESFGSAGSGAPRSGSLGGGGSCEHDNHPSPPNPGEKQHQRLAGSYDPSGNKPGSLLSEDPSYKGTRVMLYRAVPAHITTINPKDFVTLKQRFAEEHADTSAVYEEEPFRVLRALVPAEQVACANNPGEYFYVGTAPIEGRAIYEFDPDTARGHRMASLPDQDITGMTYYHGTSTLTKASGILRQGIRADKGFKRWGKGLEAVAGRVYMTLNLDEALQYACFDYEKTTNGYLFVIPGSLLKDVYPDEDALGKLAVRSWSVFNQNLAHLLDGFEIRLVELIQEHQLLKVGETPEFEGVVALGKALIPLLSDDEILQALRRTQSLAHQGTVYPTVCYRIDKDNPPSSLEELEKCPQLPVTKAASEEVGAPRIQEGGGDVRISLGDADVIAHIIPERAQAIVESLFVPPELRGRGIGTILMGTLAAWLKDHGVHYLTGMDVSEHGESSKIRQKIPGETLQFERKEEGHGDDLLPDAPDTFKEILKGLEPNKDGHYLVTRLALRMAARDQGIGSGEHAATTDSSGKFWGNAGAGCVFFAQDTGRILLSYRSEFVNEPHTWGVWGGAMDDGENPRNAALREVREETGYDGNVQLRQAYVYTNGDFRYTTFLAVVPKEFVPKLDWETEDFKWCDMDDFPSPIHFGLKAALGPIKSLVKPMLKEKVSGGKFNSDLKEALGQTEHKEAATIENGVYSMPLEEAVDEHEKLVDALQTQDPQALQEEAEEQGGELQEMKAKMAALVAKIAEELPAPVIEDFYQTTSDAMQGGVKTFNAFLAQLQTNLGDKWPGFLHAVGGYTGLRPVWDAVVEQDEDDLKQSLEDLRISPRLPSASPTLRGKPREVPLEDPHGEVKLQPDLNTMLQDPEALKHNVGLMLDYPEFRGIRGGTTQEKAEQIIEHMTDNLVWLYEQWHASHRTRAKSWYVGGNRIAHRWAQRFDCSAQAVAGVMAALSPQQHWFQNVTLAERVLSIVTEHANEPWDAAMTKVLKTRDWGKGKISRSYVEEGEDNEEAEEGEEKKDVPRPTPVSLLPILEGKTLQDLEDGTSSGDYLQALWIRAYDEAHNPNACRIVSPEGEFGDWYRKQDGKPVKNRWASFSALMKAVAIFKDPSTENISNIVGANHKVRSFYNNLIAPMSPGGDVTVDTHAVAAALLRPLAASSIPVSHNFGSGKAAQKAVRARPAYTDAKGKHHKAVEGHPRIPAVPGPASSNVTGVTGLYAFYAEAYRRAAAKVGIMPREMQSITWEAVRGLFKPHQKRKNHMEQADAYWKDYSDGYTDKETTRGKLLDFFGGIEEPAWALPNPRNSQGERHSSYSGQLPRPDGPDGGPGGTTRPRGRAGTPARASVQGVGKAALFQKRASDTSHMSNQVTAGLFQKP